MVPQMLHQGDVLQRAGEEDSNLYLVQRGQLEAWLLHKGHGQPDEHDLRVHVYGRGAYINSHVLVERAWASVGDFGGGAFGTLSGMSRFPCFMLGGRS